MVTPEELPESDQIQIQLDFHDADGKPRPMVFRNPVHILAAYQVDEVKPLLQKLQQGVESGLYAAGYLSYEAAPAFDPAFCVRGEQRMPLAWFGLFAQPQELPTEDASAKRGAYRITEWRPAVDRDRYKACIAAIREAIARGETYQTNYTIRLHGSFSGDAHAFYQDLRKRQHGHYSAYLQVGRYRILSASPELFFRWQENKLVTKPMKGTVKRGRFGAEDRAHAEWLAQSPKNRAENVMIVDLLRNDLGTIAEIGSVHVPRLFEIEQYRTVFQMTSTVEAKTREETTIEDVFSALFPCGSITGAPKVSTMKLIKELEDSPREVYCGTIGYLTPQKEAVFNVAIRTVLIDAKTGEAEYGVGGGITWDSQAEDEYDEVVAKSAILTTDMPEFSLLETMKLASGRYELLDWHLARLFDSAAYFSIPLDPVKLDAALQAYAQERGSELMRVRLLVSQEGAIALEGTPLQEQPVVPQPFAVASRPIASSNPFLFHKTTERSIYQIHKNEHPAAFDVLLWNERGELTEFTIGNLVVEIAGEKLTSPITSGLLAGTLRAELLAQGLIAERVLTLDDLARAERIWLINSVRGWVPVYLHADVPSHSA